MGNFNRSGGSRGEKKFGRKSFGKGNFDNRSSGKPAMHQAICSDCGNACEVPFKPSNDRPVYCKNCFKKNDGSNFSNSRNFDDRNYEERDYGRDSGRSAMFEATCDECGQSCEVPFKPSRNKPVFCNNCFKRNGNAGDNKTNTQLKEQLEILNIKMDRILKILTSHPEKKVKAPKLKKT